MPSKKLLVNAEEVPMFDPSSYEERKNRERKERRAQCPVCIRENIKPARLVVRDAFDRDLDACAEHRLVRAHQALREL